MGGITARIDAITALPPERCHAVLPAPRSIKIELTARCNFACSFCARSQVLRDQRDMDRSLFERLLREFRAEGVEEIGLFYLGESFLCRWLDEAVDFAKRICGFPYVFLTTNGSLATPERVEALMRAGLDSLKFSFNYASAEQFKEIAGVKGSLYTAMKRNIRAAHEVRRKTGSTCGLYASYIQYDGRQGELMKAAVAEIAPYVDEVYALPLYNQAGFVDEAEKSKGWKATAGNRGRLDAMREPLPCWAVFTEGHVTYDGKLSACCFDHDGRFEMGDLTAMAFADAWNSEKFQTLRAAHLRRDVSGTPCEQCAVGS